MAHSARPSRTRRALELVLAAVALSAGIALAVVAVLALEHPKGRAADTQAAAPIPTSTSTSGSVTATPRVTATPEATGSAGATASPAATAGTAGATNTATPTSGQLPVIVLNSTADSSLTDTADARFRALGWTVTKSGTFTGDILSTAVYYDPSAVGAQQAALRLKSQFPALKRALPKFAGLPSGPVVVVLTTDYS